MSDLPRPTAKQILKSAFWNRWGKVVGSVLAIFGLLDFVDSHFASRFGDTFKSVWGTYYVLPSLGLRTWITIVAVALLVVGLHGAYVFAMGYSKRYEELTKNKVVFELDEIKTRVFVTKDPTLITARLHIRFHNREPYDEHLRTLRLSLHDYSNGREVFTWILDDRYFHINETEIPRDQFEGMLIQGKRLTPSYICVISIDVAVDENFRIPEDLTDTHYLMVTMTATNQEPFKTRIFVNWEKATKKNGTAIRSIGAPAIRQFDDRRLSGNSD